MLPLVKGFGRRPQHDGACGCGAGVRKPPKEETAGRKRLCPGARDLWGFEGCGLDACIAARGAGA
jgi:hypothetical protein